jgi:hypothetical protein
MLKKSIIEISLHPKQFADNPEKDFTRKRKLPLKQVLNCVLSMTGKSLRGELMDYFNLSLKAPTVSALVQQRNKINYTAFEALFHSFTESVDERSLYKGYRLLAVDGSDLHTPTNKDEKSSFYEGTNGQKPYNLFHLNALYDLQRRLYVDAVVQGSKHENEHRAFVTMVDKDNSSIPTIYIADRGYESYNNMAHVIEKGQKFLIRVKDLGGNGISSRLKLNDSSFDIDVVLNLTRKQTNKAKETLDYLPHNVNFDFLPKTCRKNIPCNPYMLKFRLVRFEIADNSYELLVTNLDKEKFNIAELKELYAMRWGIETSFRDLKYSLSLSYFHSKKTEHILQEIFARLTMYNFAELITSHVVIKQKNRKYSYRINFAAAVHICRNFFLKNISPSDIEALLLMHLLPVRQRSANPRRGSPRAAPSFIYRIP